MHLVKIRATVSHIILLVLIFIVLGCKVKSISSEFPAYTDYKTPSPAPAPPGEPFNPVMSGIAKQSTPECAEWTRTAGPDESLIITGENFTRYGSSNESKDSRFKIYTSEGNYSDASILRAEKTKAVITIDKNISKWSMYL